MAEEQVLNTHNAEILLSAANKSHYPQDDLPEVALADKLRFVDVPGYGYARVSKKERAKWGKMIEEYLVTRDNLRVVVSLVDLRHEPTQDDIQMYEFLKYYEIPVIVVATKADKIPRGKWNKHESIIKKKLNFDKNDHFIVFSSVTRDGYDEAWDTILAEL